MQSNWINTVASDSIQIGNDLLYIVSYQELFYLKNYNYSTLVPEALCEAKETRGEKEASVANPTSTID